MPWSRFFRRAHWDDERAREIEAYLAMEIDDNLARGMTRVEAERAAHRKLGNATLIREEIYHMNTLGVLAILWQDLRYGARLLRRNPAFAAVAILTLALGTGANTAIFELMDAVRIRTLPVQDPQRLVEVRLAPNKTGRCCRMTGRYAMLTGPQWEQIRERQQVFSSAAAWGTTRFDLALGGEERSVDGLWVSGGFFDTLGVPALVGRILSRADDRRGCGSPGAVLSYAFWQREFGADRAAIGRPLTLDGHSIDVIGVTPATFTGIEVGRSFDVAVPLCAEPLIRGAQASLDKPADWFLDAIGRLRPDVSVAQATAQLAALSPGIFRSTLPPTYDAPSARNYLAFTLMAVPVGTGVSTLRQQYAEPLWILFGVAGLVLLVACANLANLMLARTTARERELAVRLAIGASRSRIVGQLLSESLLIAVLGSLGGLLLARWSSETLVALLGGGRARLFLDLTPDWRVFAFASGLAVATCMVFGLIPAIRATAADPGSTMKSGARGTTDSKERFGLRRVLVVGQVALSLVLVVGAVLFGRTLRNLARQDSGFRQDGVLLASLDLTRVNVPREAQLAFHDRLVTRVRAVPGVEAAGEASIVPITSNGWNDRIVVDGHEPTTFPDFNGVTPGFFTAFGTPIVAGRDFGREDAARGMPVAIVNDAFAQKYLAGTSPLGRTFQVVAPPGEPRPLYHIVGVAKNTKYSDLREPFVPIAYLDMEQMPTADPNPSLVIRSSLPLGSISSAVVGAIMEISPVISVHFQTMGALVDDSLSLERLMATLSAFFGALAALIAMIGLYGVMSYTVARRKTEIGIRMALGADRGKVLRMIVGEAGRLLVTGVVAGGILAVLAGRAARSLLYGLEPWDPTTLAASMVALASVAFLASWMPALRASRLDPTVALRED